MATTINADTSTGGVVLTGDGSGVLELQAAGVTKATLNSSGMTLATPLPVGSGGTGAASLSGITTGTATNLAGGSNGTIPYQSASGTTQMLAVGTSGQLLQSNGAAAPTWATLSTTSNLKTDLTPYDATLSLPSALGTYRQHLTVQLTATTELMIVYGSSAAFAAVWNNTTKTFGTAVLVRTAAFSQPYDVAAYGLSSTSVLVCSLVTTALETVVLSISGSTITVNTAVATTLAASSSLQQNPSSNNGVGRILLVGSSYVLNYFSTQSCFRAITVSGVTPTVGAELTFSAGDGIGVSYVFSSSVFIHINKSALLFSAIPVSVSGTTLTQGTGATVVTTNDTATVSGQLSSNRIAFTYTVSDVMYGGIVSVAGTTASISTVSLGINQGFGAVGFRYMQIFGLQAIIVLSIGTTENAVNVLTDSSGTAVSGTGFSNPLGSSQTWAIVGCNSSEVFVQQTSGANILMTIGISGNNPVLNKLFPTTGNSTVTGTGALLGLYSQQPFSNFENSLSMRTATFKTVTMNTATSFLTTSFDGTSVAQRQQAAGFTSSNVVTRSSLSNAACWMASINAIAAVNQTVYFRRVELA